MTCIRPNVYKFRATDTTASDPTSSPVPALSINYELDAILPEDCSVMLTKVSRLSVYSWNDEIRIEKERLQAKDTSEKFKVERRGRETRRL
jgi:hypothetical protein